MQMGLVALYSLARPGSAVSQEAQTVQQTASSAVRSVERSQALFGEKADTISQLWALANECSTEGWDGADARPLDPQAVYKAVAFVRALPESLPLPEVAAEPDGAVSLDWIQSRNRILSVSVGSGDRLAFAWIDGTDRGHGVARLGDGVLPGRIVDAIGAIMGVRSAPVRTA